MAELITIARPYAQAVFRRAQETGRLQEWSDMLQFGAAVASDSTVQDLINGTAATRENLAEIFINICAEQLDQEGQNLVRPHDFQSCSFGQLGHLSDILCPDVRQGDEPK